MGRLFYGEVKGEHAHQQAYGLMSQIIFFILYLTTTVVLWWFGPRNKLFKATL